MDTIAPGRYIVAVSGGVDSMALLDMLRRQSGLDVIVAHVDHGVRSDSHEDAALVEHYATQYGLTCLVAHLQLGPGASEGVARAARYKFLQNCRKTQNADDIVTAHHQDDLIETALLAIIRGTGWRGLAPFVTKSNIVRPLLNVSKNDLIGYARKYNVPWHEDSTNSDETYTRNYIRHTLIPMLDQKSDTWREMFLQHIRKQQKVRAIIESELAAVAQTTELARYDLIMAPQLVAYELLQQWFRIHTGNSLERPLAEAALLFSKVARSGKRMELSDNWQLRATLRTLIVEPRPGVVS